MYAHTQKGVQPEKGWQSLQEHLDKVAQLAAAFAASFNSADWAYNAGLLHDIGKANPIFQAYLYRQNGLHYPDETIRNNARVNHSIAGAAYSEKHFGPAAGRVLSYLIAGHHAGLPDWYGSDTQNAALENRLEEGRRDLASILATAEAMAGELRTVQRPPEQVIPENCHLWIRLLFSCLVDADFLDTEAFMNPTTAKTRSRYPTLAELRPQFEEFMNALTTNAAKTKINTLRERILQCCRVRAMEKPGLFSLTVPTGGGKTLSALAFALQHACVHGKERIIYVIPYTSIIEQTAQVMASIFGTDNVIEHHSNLDPDRETRQSRLAAENWDAPLIVTTNVQFFESLYASRTSRCRKLHNLVNSVVILDEAQLLPPELLKPCTDAINMLTRHFGVTMVLSTATQPTPPGLDTPTEIIPDKVHLYDQLKRTKFHFPKSIHETIAWHDVATQLCMYSQVLCIVNTRKDCLELYRLMPEDTIHLSAIMCGQHRSTVIAQIKKRLKEKQSVRVISTQLVEAGVDIDFPVVYRALAGLDSIAQAAGRCNREGKMEQLGQVHIFVPPKPAPRGMLRKAEDTTRELLALPEFSADTPAAYEKYFALFYARVNDTGQDYHDWLVRDANPALHFHFRTAAEHFRLIDDRASRPVFVRYGESPALLETLRQIGPKREHMRKLQRYAVNIPNRTAQQLWDDGLLEEVWPGFLAQAMGFQYSEKTGLNTDLSNPNAEELMV